VSLKLYRPVPGGLEPTPVQDRNWRRRLRSRRWRPAELANPEIEAPRASGGVVLFGGLALLTFVVLLLGYGVGLWS
jgi:hypothetical protein